MSERRPIADAISSVETFFDRLKLGYKWRFDRWQSLHIAEYLGYGTSSCVLLHGRVLDDEPVELHPGGSRWKNLRANIRRIETDEVPGATVRVEIDGTALDAVTDGDGFFRADVEDPPLPGSGPWYAATVTLTRPEGHAASAELEFFVPNERTSCVVVSDIDDTIMRTGATDLLKMIRVVLLNGPTTRVAFPGVAAFYRGLAAGEDGNGSNPVFYVSSSPWNFYGLFQEFLVHHGIPRGPIMLKDFGFSRTKLWKEGHDAHKLMHIRQLMALYPDLPLVLIGDSGQRDPEIFAELVDEAPERIAAVYLRDVTSPDRDAEVHRLGDKARERGVPWILAEDTAEASRHAAEHGLISEAAAREAAQESRRDKEVSP